jgi:hypothetical protein
MVPDPSTVAVLLLDVVNDLEFPGGERLLRHTVPMARRRAHLQTRAKRAGIPVSHDRASSQRRRVGGAGIWLLNGFSVVHSALSLQSPCEISINGARPLDGDGDGFATG